MSRPERTGMAHDPDRVGSALLAHLTDVDLAVLLGIDDDAGTAGAGARPATGRSSLLLPSTGAASDRAVRSIAAIRRQPALVLDALGAPGAAERVLERGDARRAGAGQMGDAPGRFSLVSPFLVFAASIELTAAQLAARPYRPERAGARLRIPVFDSADLVAYLAQPWNRFFLAQLLASYSRVASGVTWTRTPAGMRRRRWSDLDPLRLAVLLDEAPPVERPGIWRRLGDCALFLTGMFPDHTRRTGIGASLPRLARLSGLGQAGAVDAPEDPLAALELLGARWYRLAADRAIAPTLETDLLRVQADSFDQARSVLNTAADRFIFPVAGDWLSPSA